MLKECDDILVAAPEAFEKGSLDAMKSWFSDWKKETYAIGPLLPLDYGTGTRHSGSAVDMEIEAFLDKMLAQHGKNSVLFVSQITNFVGMFN